MIKGIKKNVIVVEPPRASSFEKIFFVMKVKKGSPCREDMLSEANRIIGESLPCGSRLGARRDTKTLLIAFGTGFLMGAALGILAVLSFL